MLLAAPRVFRAPCVAPLVFRAPCVAPLVFRAPEAPAAREARRPHFVRRRASQPGQAPPPPTGTAARSARTLRCPPRRQQWGFAPCEALWRRVAGVSEAWMASFPPCGGEAALFDVNRPISHVIPLRVFQALKSHRWDCNVCGVSRKMTMLNYVRLWGGGIPRAPAARSSSASSLSVLPGTASGTQQLEPSQLVAASSLALFRQSQFSNAT